MKASGGPQKLRFTVHACSGEDSDYPVRELLFHSPQTRGWQSPRFCKYPQEVVLRLEYVSKVQQIQILSHEYKIATRVEVFVGTPANPADADPNNCIFKRLGYLSFDSNERSSHQARELKSVHVNVPAFLIRLVIHRCHVNKLNIYNQVGIIALNLIGERLNAAPDGPPGFLQLHPPIVREQPYYNAAAAAVADLNLDIHVDTVTAAKIRELARQKDAAVANEDYDTAKAIKASIDRLKVVGQKIAQLEARKREAVEKEDYDAAKVIKLDIDKLRSAGEGAAMGSMADIAPRSKNPDDIFNRVLGGGGGRGSGGGGSVRNSGAGPLVPFDDVPVRGGRPASKGPSMPSSPGPPPELDQPDEPYAPGPASYRSQQSAGGTRHQAYDDRPAMGKGRYTPSEEQMAAVAAARRNGQAASGGDGEAPPGWPGDLPGPEPLAGATAKDAEPLEELMGEYVARAFFSKNWQLRDAALSYLLKEATQGSLSGKPEAFRTLSRMLQRGMKDKVANVYLSSLGMMSAMVDAFASVVSARDIEQLSESVLPLLVDKLGDNNVRLREASKESIMFLAGIRDANLKHHTHQFCKPIKNQTAWRPVLGILNLLQDLVPLVGISKSGDGFELEQVMEFVGKAYSSANGEVRSAAVRVTKEVFDLVGPAVRKFMPKDINKQIKEQVEAVLSGEPAGGAAEPPPPPPPPAAPPPPRGGAAKGQAPPPKRASSAASSQRAPTPPPRTPPPPAQPAGAPDDPAAFEAELEQREHELGPNHPDVAETCSNLAIVYNQRGQSELALPLYERALNIYEQHYGPDHPEVAHTLTDLAVLHLEQGREDVGRPLLERALAIQQAALGPDHPDVLAIKDVLNSE